MPLWIPWGLVAFLATLMLHSHGKLPVPSLRYSSKGWSQGTELRTLVSYSYFEKDDIQRQNFEFFLLAAVGIGSKFGQDRTCEYVIVLNGESCTPCAVLEKLLSPRHVDLPDAEWVRSAPGITLIKRRDNQGMDFAAHNTTMAFLESSVPNRLWSFAYYVFLNSSVKGPFVPKYYPFHWSTPFTGRLSARVKVVSSSLVCLPEIDLGGPGPKVESWAFATDSVGLRVLVEHGVYLTRLEKLSKDGVVVMGEYGITAALTAAGYTIDTLMAKYDSTVDWTDRRNWMCNDNVHPSRHGTYDGISMHPYEVVFLKASWHVGIPFADKYAAWATRALTGQSNTEGSFDHEMYQFAIRPEAQNKHPLIEQAYDVGPNIHRHKHPKR